MSNRGVTMVLQDKVAITDISIDIVKDKIDLSELRVKLLTKNY